MDNMPCILNYCVTGIVERFHTEYGIATCRLNRMKWILVGIMILNLFLVYRQYYIVLLKSDRYALTFLKTHRDIIFFVRPLHSKPGMESYCLSSTDQLSW